VDPNNPGNIDPVGDASREAALWKFESGEAMRTFMASQATAAGRNTGGGGWFFDWLPVFGGAAPMADDAAPSMGEADDGGQGFSTTNVQESGVDESDIVKNDGEYIYMLTYDKVHVVKATPPEALAEVAVLEIDSAGNSMYLRGSTLVVLSTTYGYYYGGDIMPMPMGTAGSAAPSGTAVSVRGGDPVGGPWSDGPQTTVAIMDMTDPASPAARKVFRFEGSLSSSRMIGSKLHLVLTTTPRLPDNPTVQQVEAMTLDEWLPDVQVVSSDGSTSGGDVVGWENCLRPAEANGYAMTMVVTADVDDPDTPLETTAVTANVGMIYASTDALYLTDTDFTYNQNTQHTNTIVHKLRFTDSGTDYVASGLVPGRPLSQYSLSDYADHLRIATTNERFSMMTGDDLSSGVYVLGVNGADLQTVGKIENIAPGEKIYSARFLGERGFLVTFRRIDPLFTMDLSDPANPLIVGELKVPGFSDHIQPLDENHLLTIGRNAEEVGGFAWVQGVLLTIFDVTDMANPQILQVNGQPARVEIGGRGTYSEANHEPKAFNYYAGQNALAFPIDLYDGDTTGPEYGSHAFTGLYVYRVTVDSGFEFLGRISSAEGLTSNNCFQGYYGSTRGVFIGDHVYSVTESAVKSAALSDVSTIVGQAAFSNAEPPIVDCFWQSDAPDLMLPPSEDLR